MLWQSTEKNPLSVKLFNQVFPYFVGSKNWWFSQGLPVHWAIITHTVQMERERESLPWDIYIDGPVRPKQPLELNLHVFEDSTRACIHVFVCLLYTCTHLKVGLDVFWHNVLRLRFVLAINHIHVKPSFLQFVQTERTELISYVVMQ